MPHKIKDNKIILTKLYFRQFDIARKLELQGSFCGKGSGIFHPKRLDPTGSATLLYIDPKNFGRIYNHSIRRGCNPDYWEVTGHCIFD